jgi:ABC-type antimicrobial peptide transport system permease subunit
MLYEQVPFLLTAQTIVLEARPGIDPTSLLDPARRAIEAAQPQVAIRDVTTMERVLTRAIGPALQVMTLLSLLSVLALALGVIGIYGVVSHYVSRRRRDWGVRLSLGMRPRRVVRQIVTRGGALVVAGIAIGLLAFAVIARLLTSLLYGVEALDPVALAGACALLLGAGLVAAWVPARRASRLDPAIVLREQ